MLHLYTNYGPNTSRIFMMLHETGLAHEVHWIDCTLGEHKTAELLAISPNAKLPGFVDDAPADGGAPIVLFESGAILIYLAELSGQFLPTDQRGRMDVLKWMFWNQSNLSPMFGQAFHFRYFAPVEEYRGYAFQRYCNEVRRLLGVLDSQLASRDFITGAYSLADIACFPWVQVLAKRTGDGIDIRLEDFAEVERWRQSIAARPGVQAAYVYCDTHYPGHHGTAEEYRKNMYGDHCSPDLAPPSMNREAPRAASA